MEKAELMFSYGKGYLNRDLSITTHNTFVMHTYMSYITFGRTTMYSKMYNYMSKLLNNKENENGFYARTYMLPRETVTW